MPSLRFRGRCLSLRSSPRRPSPAQAQDTHTRLDEIAVQGGGSGLPAEAVGPEAAAAGLRPSLTQASPVGLNLRTPSRGASRLGLTPLETPASLDIISGQTIRLRGQSSVLEAISQNGTGITAHGSPGFGLGTYTSRGFAGPNSVQTLFDGTRFYVGANTVTFPFDTWNVERIEVLRGPASVLYGDGAIGGICSPTSPTPRAARITPWSISASTIRSRPPRACRCGSSNLFDKVYAIDGSASNGFSTNWQLGRPRSVEVAYTVVW